MEELQEPGKLVIDLLEDRMKFTKKLLSNKETSRRNGKNRSQYKSPGKTQIHIELPPNITDQLWKRKPIPE
jgi:hypothetical protein